MCAILAQENGTVNEVFEGIFKKQPVVLALKKRSTKETEAQRLKPILSAFQILTYRDAVLETSK